MKINAKILAAALITAFLFFISTDANSWSIFGKKEKEVKKQPSVPSVLYQQKEYQPQRRGVPKEGGYPDAVAACADAYRKIKEGLNRTTAEPLCTLLGTSGEIGGFTTKCFVVGSPSTGYPSASDPVYPLFESIRGDRIGVSRVDDSLDMCLQLPRHPDWPARCFKINDTFNMLYYSDSGEIRNKVVEVLDAYGFEELTDPESELNTSFLNGPFITIPRMPYIKGTSEKLGY